MNIDNDAASESSIGPPPNFSQSAILQSIESFIVLYDEREHGLRSKADQFRRLAKKVENMIQRTRNIKNAGIAGAVVGLILIPLTVGFSWYVAAGGVVTAAAGSVVYASTQLMKIVKENNAKETLQKVGQEFLSAVRPLSLKILEFQIYVDNFQICACTNCELCFTKDQVFKTIKDYHKYKNILRKLEELCMNTQVLWVHCRTEIGIFVALVDVISSTADPKRDLSGEFLANVNKCASLSDQTIDNFGSMKKNCNDLYLLLRP